MKTNKMNTVKIKPDYKHLFLNDAEKLGDEAFAQMLGISYEELKAIKYSEEKVYAQEEESRGKLLMSFAIDFEEKSNPTVFKKIFQWDFENPIIVPAGLYIDMYEPIDDEIWDGAESEILLPPDLRIDQVIPINEANNFKTESGIMEKPDAILKEAIHRFDRYLRDALGHLINQLLVEEEVKDALDQYIEESQYSDENLAIETILSSKLMPYPEIRKVLSSRPGTPQVFDEFVLAALSGDLSFNFTEEDKERLGDRILSFKIYRLRNEFRKLVIRWYIAADQYTDVWAEEVNRCFGEG